MWLAGWVVVVVAVTSYPKGTKSTCLIDRAREMINQLENDTMILENRGEEAGRCSEQRLQVIQDSVLGFVSGCPPAEAGYTQLTESRLATVMEAMVVQCEIRRRCECCGPCDVFEPSHRCGSTLTITEGSDDSELQFKMLRSPRDICGGRPNCQVILEFATRSEEQQSDVMEQIVFRDGCSMEIPGTNWDRTHSVNFAAKIDRTNDKQQKTTIGVVMKTLVDGLPVNERNLCSYEVNVVDRDFGRGSRHGCSSMNDPHITTFDGTKYDNFVEGEFVLYQHNHLGFQVNMMYQKCNRGATCNCGVAVKSGDTVFITEKCRRRGQHCPPTLPYCGGNRLHTAIYKRDDDIASHMRVFPTKAGTGFDILLPHGTLVKTRAHTRFGSFINVWVFPSAADLQNTTGLCGFYSRNDNDDLQKPDGTTHRLTGTGTGQQPDAFSMSWKVHIGNSLFYGASMDPYTPGHYCDCPSTATPGNRVCNGNALVDASNLDATTEKPLHFFNVYDLDDYRGTHARGKRDISSPESFIDSLDLDPNDEPSEETLELDSSWSEENATLFCDDAIKSQQDWARKCLTIPEFDPDPVVQNCINDIMITGSTVWTDTALEAIKLQCLHTIEVNSDFRQNEGRELEQEIRDQLCPQDCSGHGRCQQGSCICNDGYVGVDCLYHWDTRPEDLSLPDGGLCNTRASDCSFISVLGDKLIDSNNLTCHLQPVQVTGSGLVVTDESSVTVLATYISINQIICQAPTKGSYLVDVSNDGVTSSGHRILHIAHDPYCYDCFVGDADGARCTRTTSGCEVDGQCYKAGEDSPHSVCYTCNTDKSVDSFSRKASIGCYTVEIIVAVCILVCVVTIILTIVCCCRKRQKIRSVEVAEEKPSEHSNDD